MTKRIATVVVIKMMTGVPATVVPAVSAMTAMTCSRAGVVVTTMTGARVAAAVVAVATNTKPAALTNTGSAKSKAPAILIGSSRTR